MNLTDADKQIIKDYIDRGEPLPAKYKLMLFADAPEMELVWQGKSSEVTSVVLPFQSIEQIDEPRSEVGHQVADLFAFDSVSGRQSSGWTNKLIWGDNKLVLSSLKNGPLRRDIEAAGGLKLIYIDPPFDVGADFSVDIEVGDETLTKEPSVIEEVAYRDTWGRGTDSYLAMMSERLALMYDLLAESGSIFVHCDWHVGHYLKLLLDEIFGSSRFLNEIVWYYYNKFQGNVDRFASNHDTIFWYSRSERFHFKRLREKRDAPIKQLKRVWDKEKGAIVNAKGPDGKVLEILPKVDGKKLTVTLKDFGVFYRQDDLNALGEQLKPGGSKVTVESGQVVKIVKDKKGKVSREVITKKWTDWIDYWAVDFDYENRREIIRVLEGGQEKEVWTGNYIFENEWQSYRTRNSRTLELSSGKHEYEKKGRYKVAVKVIDIFGNDTTKVVEIKV